MNLKAAKGWHTLHARTIDSAGLLSGTSTFQFGVGPKPAALLVPDRPTTLQEGAIDTPAPLLSGVVTSPDQARVSGAFALYDASGKELPGVVLPQPSEESGSRVATAVPEGTLVPGTTYQWAMRACGEAACSPWTPRRTFTAKDAKADPVPHTRTVEITALSDATAPVGAEDCAGKDCAAVRDETLHVGTPGGASWRSWLKADPAAIPAGARITDARLKLHRADCSADDDCVEPAPTLKDLAEAWSPEQSGQALAAAASDEAFDTEEGLPLPLQDLNVGPLEADWLETGENHGLSLQLGDEKDAAPGMAYHSSRAADPAKRPRLAVSYIPSAAPGAPQDVKAVPADGGLLATWNAPQDPGSATDALKYTVLVHKGATEVARQTVDDTRAVFSARKPMVANFLVSPKKYVDVTIRFKGVKGSLALTLQEDTDDWSYGIVTRKGFYDD
ncbi:DNRLRE domain-containing protein [Streptomyces venezuelae]